ncbi:MAG: hypothetical protein KGJ62_09235 [Armatimonadetes bacterium]|nr:hypothetical protein [Armatimonadota bacterium]MDE2207597.1 hypothetical protein [Armatimonadota bacterium]
MRHRFVVPAALAALGAIAAGCGAGGSSAANAAAPHPASGPPSHTVDGITFSQAVTTDAARGTPLTGGAWITFTVSNGTKGSVVWPGEPYFSGTCTSATGQVTYFPPKGGVSGLGGWPAINIGPGQSASVVEPADGLPPGTYTIASYIGSSLYGTAFQQYGIRRNGETYMPGYPDKTQTATPVTITVP